LIESMGVNTNNQWRSNPVSWNIASCETSELNEHWNGQCLTVNAMVKLHEIVILSSYSYSGYISQLYMGENHPLHRFLNKYLMLSNQYWYLGNSRNLFPNSSFISNTKSQLAQFNFNITKKLMFWPCPEGMANSGPNMAIVETFSQL